MKSGPRDITMEELISLHTIVTPSGCLEWTGGSNEKGYGRTRFNGRQQPVHRVVWQLINGPIPKGRVI